MPVDVVDDAGYKTRGVSGWGPDGNVQNLPGSQPAVSTRGECSSGRLEFAVFQPSVRDHSDNLEPLAPAEAMQMYLDEQSHELADATIQSHRYRLKQFVQWCEQDGIDNLNEFSGRDIHRFRVKRRNEDGLATASMKGQLATLRMFFRFCATIDAVEPGLDKNHSPDDD